MTAGALAAAMVLDAVLGEPAWLWSRVPHPTVLMGRAVNALEHWLHKPGWHSRASGIVATIALAVGAGLLGTAIASIGWIAEVLFAATLLAQRSLAQHVQAVGNALRLSLGDGRLTVSNIVSRDTHDMTRSQVTRAAIESAAENLSDGVIAPAFWFLVAGLPGLMIYKAVNTADSMIGYRNSRYRQFGWCSARLDDVLNLIPARLTALILAALCGRLRQIPEIAGDARAHRSPNAGWPEAAMARALDIALAGPRSYDGQERELAWVNKEGRREIGAKEIDRAVAMLWKAWGVFLTCVILLALPTLL